MNLKNFSIITLIFVIPLVAYFILAKPDASMASKSASTNKPQIIRFSSLMCYDCKKLDGVLKEVYPKYKNKVNLVEIHVSDNDAYTKQQISKYNINLVPTLILLDSKGKKVAKSEGYVDKAHLEKMMKDLANE